MLIAKTKKPAGRKTKSTKKIPGARAQILKATMMLVMGSMTSLSITGSALADPAKIRSKFINVDSVYQHNIVRVISRGHEKFDAIEDGGNIKLWVTGHVDPKGLGRVLVGGFLLGWCGGAPNCSQFTVRYIHSASMNKKLWSFDHELNVPTDLISHSGPDGIAPYPDGDRLIKACNDAMNGQGPVEAVTLDSSLTVSASAHTRKWKPFNNFEVGNWNETHYGGDVGVSNSFPIKIECVPSEELLSQPIAVSNRVVDTASGSVGACPRRVEHGTSIYYRRPTTATFKIKQNGSVVKTVERSTESQSLSDGTIQHVIHYDTDLTSPEGNNNYRVKVVGGPESDAVQLNIDCSAFDITFANLNHVAPNNGTCPRQVWQTASFITNGPGRFTYELKHKLFGVIYEKEVEAQLFDSVYKAVDTRVIQLVEGETEFLAQVKGSDGINSGWQSINIECEARVKPELIGDADELTIGQNDPDVDFPKPPGKVNPRVDAAGDLTVAPTPTHSAEETPKVLVAPLPKPSIKTAPLPSKRDSAAKRTKEREAARKAKVRKAAKKAAARKAAEKAQARKAAKKAEARKAAKRAAARKAAAKKAEARKAAKKAAARKAKKKAEARKAAKKAAARKAAKRANAKKSAKRVNSRKCPKGKTLIRGRCIKLAG